MDLRPKPYVLRLFFGAFVLFFVVKVGLRPLFLGREIPLWLEVFVYSTPNVIEAVMGMAIGCGILLVLKARTGLGVPDRALYVLATVVLGVFFVTQEMKLHDFGGPNLYDPYDVAATVVGLVGTLAVFWHLGVAEARA